MIYLSRHIKIQRVVFSFQVVLSKTTHVGNTLRCVYHASLSSIDPFDNSIIKLRCYVLNKLFCLTPVAMRQLSVY